MVYIRPHSQDFLEKLSRYFEIVLVTDLLSQTADPLIESVDANDFFIRYKLYKQDHTKISLERLGRDHSKTVIVHD